jgi:GNAT superfamily N-acetyltransferase
MNSTRAPISHSLERYALQLVRSPQEWSAYHAIRRDAIFSVLLPGQAYDEHDPDEFEHRHLAHVLIRDGEIIGTVRIDLVGESQAGLRLIAIRRDLQRQGHGSILLSLAEGAARSLGRTEVVINAHPTSLTFYLANGYREGEWRDSKPVPAVDRSAACRRCPSTR